MVCIGRVVRAVILVGMAMTTLVYGLSLIHISSLRVARMFSPGAGMSVRMTGGS